MDEGFYFNCLLHTTRQDKLRVIDKMKQSFDFIDLFYDIHTQFGTYNISSKIKAMPMVCID